MKLENKILKYLKKAAELADKKYMNSLVTDVKNSDESGFSLHIFQLKIVAEEKLEMYKQIKELIKKGKNGDN